MALKDTSIIWKVTICLQVSALIVCLVGFGTNYLVYFQSPSIESNGGLWETYFTDINHWDTDDYLRIFRESSEWLDVSKVMMSISIGVHILCTALTVFTAFFTATKFVVWGLAVSEFTSALSGLIGCSVAAAKLKSSMEDRTNVTYSVSYSFILFLVAQFAFAGTGLLLLLDARLNSTSRPKNAAPPMKIAAIF